MSEAPHLMTSEDGAILIATLNRPDKLNALSAELMGLFETALHRFRDTPALKVLLIRATGRYFSAGADMRGGNDHSKSSTASAIRERHRRGLHGMHRIYDEMEAIEKPIVVAHHATCVGGGLELSLSCDFRLAAKSALRVSGGQIRRAAGVQWREPAYPHRRHPLGTLPDHGQQAGGRRSGAD